MSPASAPPEWRGEDLRRARRALGLSAKALGLRCGFAESTVRKYENGSRRPGREELQRLLDCLQVASAESNAILEGLGLARTRTLFPADRFPDYFFNVAELAREVERVPWPQFVVNDWLEVVAANRAAQRLWGIDFREEARRRGRTGVNLLAVAGEAQFAARIGNWVECAETLVAVMKAWRTPESLEQPSPYFEQVLSELQGATPELQRSFASAWQRASPQQPKVRWHYRVEWRGEGGGTDFHCLVSTASEPDALAFNDWIPESPEDWLSFKRTVGSRD